jgi:hypothetical protein
MRARLAEWKEDNALTAWISSHLNDDGTPAMVISPPHYARRLRKTVKTTRVAALGGTLTDVAADDHHIEVFRNHYAHGTTALTLAGRSINRAQERVFLKITAKPLLLDAEAKRRLAEPAIAEAAGMTVEQAAGMQAGEFDMGLTNCRDPYDSPFTPVGKPCHVAPAMCMICRNAVVFISQLPRLLLLAAHIERMRDALDMFRRTMSIICSQEPDSEIALGHQLKHLARRAMANRVTQGYSQMDANWAKEFDTQLELAAARRLVELLKSRRSGASVAVGPGAARLHAGLDHVISTMDSDPVLRAQLADEQIEVLLLRDQFADLHFGTVNHCLWDAGQAECQNSLPEDQRGQTPVLGACQPARCRNSVISRDKHAPIWLAEEVDLMRILRDKRPAKPRREALQNRLSEVQLITSSWPIEERI